ncbi:hydrogenase maturation nickel metallochaperone HypA [Celerinatantimonas diazotrophica]|uniref:Hydrogenase maturation factor HypA n=1 Tax=Celerinatantimonas diazotrophica TaxID=412034 RepID=A0A4R1K9L7_9GAMM|nr:hydrogenase maturation nickel metallochaperone HypA [Celerinatantimonas diazotrophica]TCK61108.1 hydrogenase-3 nickel incorporation protein HypA [Celerinatantimonas diazotrophica]CAG9295157.1 Hydrogenase maturation factor HypA [Celerinatantimonas diazotrophica]
MHEITLCQQTIETVEQYACANGARAITDVWLRVGAFSCIEPAAMNFCFELVCRETLAEGCKLHLELQVAHCFCNHCQKEIELLSSLVKVCPHCGSHDLNIDADNDVTIERIEII